MLFEIFQALAEQLEDNITMWDGWDLHVEPTPFPIAESPNINMRPGDTSGLGDGTAGFADIYGGVPVALTFRVPSADLTAATAMALAFMDADGDLSILAAIDADRTLGGAVDTIGWDVWPWTRYLDFPVIDGDGILLGSELNIVVLPKAST